MTPTILLLIASSSLSVLFGICYFLVTRASSGKNLEQKKQLSKLKQDLSVLTKSLNVLRELSSQYFVTMHENGFVDLCNIETALGAAIEHCDMMIKEGDKDRTEQLMRFLYVQRGFGSPPPSLWGCLGDQASHIENWGERARKLLLQLTEAVDQSSNDLKEIGGAARRKRKNTILMLNEARLAIESLT